LVCWDTSAADAPEVFVTGSAQPTAEESLIDPDAVRVSRSVPSSPDHVWECLIAIEGTEALLGPGARLGSKGESWRSQDGAQGVVRSYHPLEQLRVSWHESDDDPPGIVDLHLDPRDGGTRLELVHERLPDGVDTGALAARWEAALERLSDVVSR
jgi:uncharacterized protein YndB with AHSA1/START domain